MPKQSKQVEYIEFPLPPKGYRLSKATKQLLTELKTDYLAAENGSKTIFLCNYCRIPKPEKYRNLFDLFNSVCDGYGLEYKIVRNPHKTIISDVGSVDPFQLRLMWIDAILTHKPLQPVK